ncbi:ATP-binding cassette domain-containing protein [Clostridium sp. D33t1_170424_F3]|uniref:ABC transporter ATP-binding protein n=1 Tax=Clostridium sp. D33t1_170424_F3 TaxID=2787099 RepID=UPI0018AB9228|nr:ATP-binding cassette domain-containing protein [Clostridium sp. D33t1_170424_F3]
MLELKNISLHVENSKDILNDVSLTVGDGKFVVITGPNGGGKSTLAKVAAGILSPTSGQIYFNGQDITQSGITDRARLGISYAFQQPVRFKGIKVRDLITLAAGRKLTTAGVCEYLSEVGLCARDYVDREVNASLSGGEIKRIEIAMVMARGTQLSIFDEPEAGIDLWSFQNLIEVFRKLHNGIQGSSIIIISHQERIMEIADEIVVLSDGKVLTQGPREEVLPKLLGGTDTCRFCPKEVG